MEERRFPTPAEREKRTKLQEMLDGGWVMVHVDPSRTGVDLPEHLREEAAVRLNLSRQLGASLLELGPLVVRANLSFGGVRYPCVLPWDSIFGLTSHADGESLLFPHDVPAVLKPMLRQAEATEPGDARSTGEATAAAGGRGADDDDDTDPPRPHLRLVK